MVTIKDVYESLSFAIETNGFYKKFVVGARDIHMLVVAVSKYNKFLFNKYPDCHRVVSIISVHENRIIDGTEFSGFNITCFSSIQIGKN